MEWDDKPTNRLDPRSVMADVMGEDNEITGTPENVKTFFNSLNAKDGAKFFPERMREDGILETMPPIFDRYPAIDEIGIMYGGGKYRFRVDYFPKNWDDEKCKKPQSKTSDWFVLSEEAYEDMHIAYVERKRNLKLTRLRQKAEDERAATGTNGADPVELLIKGMQLARNNSGGGMDVSALLQFQAQQATTANGQSQQMMMEFAKMQAQMFTMMITMSNKSTEMLVSLMGGRSSESADKIADKMLGMLEKGIGLSHKVQNMQLGKEIEELDEEREEPKSFLAEMWEIVKTQLIPNLGLLKMMGAKMAQQAVETKIAEVPGGAEALAKAQKELAENATQRAKYLRQAVLEGQGAKGAAMILQSLKIKFDPDELEAIELAIRSEMADDAEVIEDEEGPESVPTPPAPSTKVGQEKVNA